MSGRALSIEYNQDGVDNLIEEALQSDNQNLRRFSEEHMNIDIQAKKYCDLKDGTGVQRRA